MCEFKSAIVLKGGEVYIAKHDSHSHMIAEVNLHKETFGENILVARVEYIPDKFKLKDGKIDWTHWDFRIDEQRDPEWLDEELKDKAIRKMQRFILSNNVTIIKDVIIVTIYYSNGELSKKCSYKNDKPEGEYLSYHNNGELSKKCNYKNGKLEGEYLSYHSNGKLYIKCNYKNGKLI